MRERERERERENKLTRKIGIQCVCQDREQKWRVYVKQIYEQTKKNCIREREKSNIKGERGEKKRHNLYFIPTTIKKGKKHILQEKQKAMEKRI